VFAGNYFSNQLEKVLFRGHEEGAMAHPGRSLDPPMLIALTDYARKTAVY